MIKNYSFLIAVKKVSPNKPLRFIIAVVTFHLKLTTSRLRNARFQQGTGDCGTAEERQRKYKHGGIETETRNSQSLQPVI